MRLISILLCTGLAASSTSEPRCTVSGPLRLQLFGDSTQAGWDGATRQYAAEPPAVLLQRALDDRFGAGIVTVESRAVQGTTAVQLVAGADGLNAAWPAPVNADVVVINHGINDATHHGSLAAYRAALQVLAAAPAKVIFETPNAVRGYDLAPYANAMRDAAAQHGAALADVYEYATAAGLRTPDWAHPSAAQYAAIVRDTLAPKVVETVCRHFRAHAIGREGSKPEEPLAAASTTRARVPALDVLGPASGTMSRSAP